MPIPDTPAFEALLSSFSVTKLEANSGGWRELVAIPSLWVNEYGRCSERPALRFWYREQANISIDALLKKISTELVTRGHPSNLDIAATVVGFFASVVRPEGSAVTHMNRVLDGVTDAELTQHYLTSIPEGVPVVSAIASGDIGPFRLGPFDPKRLRYQSEKAGSNYFQCYESTLSRIPFSVERQHKKVKVLCSPYFGHTTKLRPISGDLSTLVPLVDRYFELLSSVYFEDFFEEMAAVQEVPMALGSGWLDLKAMRQALGAHSVSIYLNIGESRAGFVSPTTVASRVVNLGGAHLGIPSTMSFLKERFDFASFTKCEIHQSLKSFCHFISVAESHASERRRDEAFLHYVIALDLLLGEIRETTAAVSSRGAVLTHRTLRENFATSKKDLQTIYAARSKYVHEGSPPNQDLLDGLRLIAREIAFCLFRLQRDPGNQSAGFLNKWLKNVDFVAGAIEAGKAVSEEDWDSIGVAKSDDIKWTDFIRQLRNPS